MMMMDEACIEQVLKESRGHVRVWVFMFIERPM